MKKHFGLLLIIFSFVFCTSVNADSLFTAEAEVPDDVTENQIKVILGFYSEENMIAMEDLTYDSRYLEFDSVVSGEHFNVTISEPRTNKNNKTITILADSNYAFEAYNYAELTFNITGKMKVGSGTDITISNIKGLGTDKTIHVDTNRNLYIHRLSEGNLEYNFKELNSATKFEIFMRKNLIIIILVVIALIGSIIALIIFKRRQKLLNSKNTTVSKQELIQSGNIPSNTAVIAPPPSVTIDNNVVQTNTQEPVQPQEPIQPVQQPVVEQSQAQPVVEQPVQDNTQNIAFGNVQSQPVENLTPVVETQVPQPIQQQVQQVSQSNDMASIFSNANQNTQEVTSVETTQVTQTVETPQVDAFNIKPEETNNNNNNTNIMSIIGLLLLGLCFVSYSVQADGVFDDSMYDIDGLRKCLVSHTCSMEYDYNSDNKIDLLDLLATKDLSRTILDETSYGTGHGFEKINYKKETTTKKTKATKAGKTSKTTTNKTTKATTSGGTPTEKTTKEQTTRVTTEKTTKATTQKVTQTPKYTVKLNIRYSGGAKDGVSSTKSFSNIQAGGSGTSTFTLPSGYTFGGLSCLNGTAIKYEDGKFIVSGVNSNDDCSATISWDQQTKVSISVVNGSASQTSVSVKSGSSTSVKITPNSGYTCAGASANGSNGVSASISADCTLNITGGTKDGTAKVSLVKGQATYSLSCAGSNQSKSDTVGKTLTYNFVSDRKVSKVTCSDGSNTGKSCVKDNSSGKFNCKVTVTTKNTSGSCSCELLG